LGGKEERVVGRAGSVVEYRRQQDHSIVLTLSLFSLPPFFLNRMETVGSAFVKKEEEMRSQGKRKGTSSGGMGRGGREGKERGNMVI
jgi:hypothetical protein